jgi:hypothetical protein
MASGKKRRMANNLRDKLRLLGDAYDTDAIYRIVYDLFRAMKKGGVAPETLFGKRYKRVLEVPDEPWRRVVTNLVTLRSMHVPPKEIVLLLKEDAGFDTEVLTRVFKDSLSFYRLQYEAVAWVLQRSEALHQLVREKGLRSVLLSEDFAGKGVPPTRPALPPDVPPIPLSPVTVLLGLDKLRELESRSDHLESPDGRAEYACYLFEVGSYSDATRVSAEVLNTDPWHGMANYVGAMLSHAEAIAQSQTAAQKVFIADLTASDGAGFVSDAHEEEALQHHGNAAHHQQQSLIQYLIALRHWPRNRIYYDHSRRREEVQRTAVVMLAQRARGRDAGTGLALHGLLPQHLNSTTPVPDLDAMALEVLKSAEPEPNDWGFGSGPHEGLLWLDLYRVLDSTEYQRFSLKWLARLDRCNADDAKALADHPAFIHHLRRLLPNPDDRRALLQKLERRCHNAVTYMWNSTTRDMLTADMRERYDHRDFEEALSPAKERVAIPNRSHRADIYDHVRVLYDLSIAAMAAGDTAASARWLCLIVETYPNLRVELRRYGKDYLELVDEEFYTYADTFGNKEDILFCDDNGEDAPATSTPLGRHIARLLENDQIEQSVKVVLRTLLPEVDDQ